MSKRYYIFFVFFVLVFNISLYSNIFVGSGNTRSSSIDSPMNVTSLPSHDPISVYGNAGFASSGIFTGYGNSTHPYIFKDYFIQAGTSNGITISTTDAYFIIENIWINGSTNSGIYFDNVKNGKVINCTITNNTQNGILLGTSSNNLLINNTVKNSEYGIFLSTGCSSNTLINNSAFVSTYGFLLFGYTPNFTFDNVLLNNSAIRNSCGFCLSVGTYNISFIHNFAFNNTQYGFNINSDASSTLANSFTNNTANYNNIGIQLISASNFSLINNIALHNYQFGFNFIQSVINNCQTTTVNIAKYNGIADFNIDGSLYWSTISDIVISRTVLNDSITWYATSSSASTYTIYINNSEVRSDVWISGKNITYFLANLAPNTYNITLIVRNSNGYTASFSSILTIPEQKTPVTDTTTIISTDISTTTVTTAATSTVTTTSKVPPESETTTIVETSTTIERSITTIVSQILETVSKTTEGFEIVVFCLSFLGLLLIRRKRESNK